MTKVKSSLLIIIAGLVVGIASVVLVATGNPVNMGFCIACFLRDIAGAVQLHTTPVVQYVRPEIIGLVLGAMVMALISGEFKVRGGSAPVSRFVLGFCVMVGALVFLGCPLRMVIRLGGGDISAIVGLLGFVVGVLGGVFFLKKGFSFKKSQPLAKIEGFVLPAINLVLLVLVVTGSALLVFSEKGPGSMRAPIAIALIAGLIVGALAQKSRLCMAGGIRDAFMFKDFHLLWGFVAIFVAVLVGNLIVGASGGRGGFNPGLAVQPVAHSVWIWNFLGMVLVGVGSVLLGGCPLRQLILAGSGSSDSTIAVFGMVVGAAFCHNFKLAAGAASAATADAAASIGGPGLNGKIAVVVCLVVVVIIALCNTKKEEAK